MINGLAGKCTYNETPEQKNKMGEIDLGHSPVLKSKLERKIRFVGSSTRRCVLANSPILFFVSVFALLVTTPCSAALPCFQEQTLQDARQETDQEDQADEKSEAQQENADEPKKATPLPYAPALKILEYQEIPPTFEGIQTYLQVLHPNHPTRAVQTTRMRRLIVDLGDERFRVRRLARQQLVKSLMFPEADLKEAAASSDPEVASSARAILDITKKRAPKDSMNGVTRAVCQVVVGKKLKGLSSELVKAMPLFSESYTLQIITEATLASATPEDAPFFRESIKQGNREQRLASINSLVSVSSEEQCVPDLQDLLEDEDDFVRVLAARELANFGKRESMTHLIDMLGSEEMNVRVKCVKTLRSLTGLEFGYFAFDKKDMRDKAIDQWKEWLAKDGKTAEISFPLKEVNLTLGKILISDYSANKVVELDMEGNVLWEVVVTNAWAVQGLPNGNRLVAQYEPSKLIEYDLNGDQVWELDVPGNVMGLDRHENGNTLVACSSADEVREYNREGEIVWEKSITGRPTEAQYLENGNILVTLMNQNKVVQIDREGKVVWEVDTASNPLHGRWTVDDTMIATTNEATEACEYNHAGNIVNRFELTVEVTACRRLVNGDTLIASENFVKLLAPDGTTRWEYKDLTYCYGISPF